MLWQDRFKNAYDALVRKDPQCLGVIVARNMKNGLPSD